MLEFLYFGVFISLRIAFVLANNAESDGIPSYAAFHLGLHYLQNVSVYQ